LYTGILRFRFGLDWRRPLRRVIWAVLCCAGAGLISHAVHAHEQVDTTVNRMVAVPAATSLHGCSPNDRLCDADEGALGGVLLEVPAFMIDIHETSVQEYRQCVDAGVCARPFDFRRVHYCNYDAPGRDHYPVNCVNWPQALQYCGWRGGRLAYAVEWERAARAGTQTAYPWGDQKADCTMAVMDPGKPGEPDTQTDGCWRDLSWPRGQFSPNALGLYDMVGGTSEWVMDWYSRSTLSTHYAQGKLTGPISGDHKVIKGGSWDEKHRAQRVSNMYHKPKTGNPDLYGSNGIRCVVAGEQSLQSQR